MGYMLSVVTAIAVFAFVVVHKLIKQVDELEKRVKLIEYIFDKYGID